jgi:hypothetical protein
MSDDDAATGGAPEEPHSEPPAPASGSLADPSEAEAARAAARNEAMRKLGLREPLPLTIIREYKGKQQKDANGAFAAEAARFAAVGYVVTSQSWAQGQWGCGAWLLGAILILAIGFGLLILLYLLVVKPAGTLTVTYTLQSR